MSYRIINAPHFVALDDYRKAIEEMLSRVTSLPEVIAVYTIGSVGNPGISDIDMVVVTKKNSTINTNFLHTLTTDERYLFTHNLYAISEKHFPLSEYYTFFHNYSLAYGNDLRTGKTPSPGDIDILKKQVAKEFIVKMYINLFVQEKYRVLRMRDLLLHVKALQYDFDFLGISEGRVIQLVQIVIGWRKIWFQKQPSQQEILNWWKEFYVEFEKFAQEVLADQPFYTPDKPHFRIAKNITLKPSSSSFFSNHYGIVLPNVFSFVGKRFFRLQNKLNRFEFNIPSSSANVSAIIAEKFAFEKELTSYGKQYLPSFLPLTSSLHMQ